MRSGLAAVGLEPTPPKRLVPKTSALFLPERKIQIFGETDLVTKIARGEG